MISTTTRRTLLAALTFFLLLPSLAPAQDALPPADELIDRYVEAIGGREAVLSKEGSRSTGTFSMPAVGIEGSMEVLTATEPTRILSRVEIPGLGLILNGYDGEVGWSVDPNLGPRLLEGGELDALVEGSSHESTLRDASLFQSRETVEKTEMNDQACYKVHLVWNSGRETYDCYSEETGLIVASMATQESPMGSLEAVTLISDYEDFGGVMTPTRMTQQVMGQEQLFTIDSVEYTDLGPEAFEPPEAIQALIDQRAEGGE